MPTVKDNRSPAERAITLNVDLVAPYRVTVAVDCLSVSVEELAAELPHLMREIARQHRGAVQLAMEAKLGFAAAQLALRDMSAFTQH